jgi:hypothetical protein
VVQENQVRGAAWSLRQIDEAAWASPDGSPEHTYFAAVAQQNWSWLVAQIPAWTVQQGEAHGWLPGDYGAAGALPPWQQDYFASTALAAARTGNADAMTFLKWEANFLVGRFTHAAEGFAQHDGAAYLIAISDPATGASYTSWAEIGAQTAARGWSNGAGWEHSQGDYPQLALATLAGIAEVTGSVEAATAYHALLAETPPFTTAADFQHDPTFSIAAPIVPPAEEALSIRLGAEAWNGDPIAIVSVDGVEVFHGAVSALHSQGGAEIQLGQFSTHAPHQLTVDFTNDAWGGTAATDRNLYVEDIRIDGVSTGRAAALLVGGPVAFDLAAAHPALPPAHEGLSLRLSEDAWQGDARYSVALDGVVLLADGTATASHALGQHDLLNLAPALSAGPHSLVVSFTNDAWGGTASTDRNLYVDGLSVNGVDLGQHAALFSAGEASFSFTIPAAVPATPLTDTLRIGLSADSWRGDPRFLVFIDGKQVGDEHSATASHAAGQAEFLVVEAPHLAGAHELDVRFINDGWGGTADTDRNLYVESVALNGTDLHGHAALFSAGDAIFAF